MTDRDEPIEVCRLDPQNEHYPCRGTCTRRLTTQGDCRERVDRSHIAPRNAEIYARWQTGRVSYETLAQQFGLARGFIKLLIRAARKAATEPRPTAWQHATDRQTQQPHD